MRLPEAKLLELAGARARLELVVPAGHPCFDGHFPGRPILPGVVQIDWAIRLGEQHLGPCTPFRGFGPIKFMRTIGADATLLLALERDAARNVLRFDYSEAGATCSTGRVLFGTAPGGPA